MKTLKLDELDVSNKNGANKQAESGMKYLHFVKRFGARSYRFEWTLI
jgi:hypothetical protein